MASIPCCNPKCKSTGAFSWKGLCGKCYKEAKQLVESGKTTWVELAGLKLCRIPESETSFESAFLDAKEDY